MNFPKNKKMFILVALIILVIYNVISFTFPFSKHRGFWIGYIFVTLSFFLTVGVCFFAFQHQEIKSKFYGVSLVFIMRTYFITQIIIGFIEMIIPDNFYRYEIVLNIIILAACLIGLIGVNFGKKEIERLDKHIHEKVFFINTLQTDVESLITKTTQESTKKNIKALIDTIHYSDPMSNHQLSSLENKIAAQIVILAENISNVDMANSLCDELQELLADRNRKCKILK